MRLIPTSIPVFISMKRLSTLNTSLILWEIPVIAGISMGFWSSAEQGVENLRIKTVTHPIEKNAQIYQEMFSINKELYPAVKPSFDKIALL